MGDSVFVLMLGLEAGWVQSGMGAVQHKAG